jgi:hypothetical protein
MGMAELRDGFGFALEPLAKRRVGRHVRRQHFDRDGAVQPRVARAIDLSHSPGANQPDDFIGAEARARLQRHV